MTKSHRSHDVATIDMFRRDPTLAADYLNDVLATGDEVDLMMALRYLSTAFGGVQEIARRADANPNTMYRTLSEQGNPSLKTLRAILSSMGLRLAVQPISAGEAYTFARLCLPTASAHVDLSDILPVRRELLPACELNMPLAQEIFIRPRNRLFARPAFRKACHRTAFSA